MRARFPVVALFVLAGCGGGGGGSEGSPPPPPAPQVQYTDPQAYSSAATASLAAPNEITAVTQHRLTLDGKALDYTATVGHLTAMQNGVGPARASFFYVAYTLNAAAPTTRPVTFFYNGGPGSASVWLHLGSFGPKRLAAGVPNANPAPFALIDNAESLLDLTDLVFVDAVGSGYSQAIAPGANRDFWGVDDDAAVFRDFVMTYVARNNRTASPRFLFGESYGGPRTAVLVDLLEAAGMRMHGVVLQSPAMNYNSSCDISNNATRPCTGFIPSYGASGAWFNRTTPSPAPAQVDPFMGEMRTLASTRYDPAVRALLASNAPPDAALVRDVALSTGPTEDQWRSRFNMGPSYYRTNLIPGTLLGRYDTRITAPGGNADNDPSSNVISQSFAVRINEYLAALGYTNPSSYTLLSNAIQTWRFAHDGNQLPDTIPDLAAALAQNPSLKVLAVNGYHDVATPFYQTELDLARLGTSANITVRNYMGGHMTYLDDTSRPRMKADLAAWYRSALGN